MRYILSCLLMVAFCFASLAEEPTSISTEDQFLGKWVRHDIKNHSVATNGLISIRFLPHMKVEWRIVLPEFGTRTRTGTYRVETSGNIVWPKSKSLVLRIQPRKDNTATTSGAFQEDGTPILLSNVGVGKDIDNRLPLGTELLKFRNGHTEYFFTKRDSQQKPEPYKK